MVQKTSIQEATNTLLGDMEEDLNEERCHVNELEEYHEDSILLKFIYRFTDVPISIIRNEITQVTQEKHPTNSPIHNVYTLTTQVF